MSDDLSKVGWGAEIPVLGPRPDWLSDEDHIAVKNDDWRGSVIVGNLTIGSWKHVTAIRLPADHPYYRQAYKPTPAEHANGVYDPDCAACREYAEPDMGNPISEPIAKRMEALVRRVADDEHFSDSAEARAVTREARAIVALLPEPVDADLVEARKLACENSRWDRSSDQWRDVMTGKQDRIPMVSVALAAIRRGRALERDSREG